MTSSRKSRWFGLSITIGLGLAVTLAVVPSALGMDSDQQLDPWAYKLLHPTVSEVITEHSAGQNAVQVHRPRTPAVLITEHSLGQDPNRRAVAPTTAYASGPASSGFDWGDAGVGAATAAGAVFLLAGSMLVWKRKVPAHRHS
jgi:hypothetical protein